MKRLFNLIISLSLPFVLLSQVQFMASTDARQVPLGEVFEVKFTLENGQGSNFRPPTFGEFNVVSGPNRMNSMTIVNGNSRSSESYSYVLQTRREGTFTLGVASIDVKGKTYTTTPLSISVEKGQKQTPNDVKGSKDDVFIRAETSANKAYVGQQIILDYKLYTRANISGVNRVNESKYDGFFKLEVNDFPHNDSRVTIGGKQYLTRILQRIALFPQRDGIFKIEPFSLQLGIVKGNKKGDDDDPFGQFFSAPVMDNRVVSTNEINIEVLPLPANAPMSFTGASGDFKTEFGISKTDATTDDVISLKMNITGNGDAKRWQAPKLAPIDGLEFYEPKIVKEQSFEKQGEWQTTKEVEYLIVPKKTGTFALTPEFTFFNTEGGNYKTESQNFELKIAQGSNKSATLVQEKVKDILGIKTTTAFVNQTTTFSGTPLFWTLFSFPFLLFGGAIGYKRWQIQNSKKDITVIKRENAPKIAESRLSLAQEFLKKGNTRLFYDEVSKALFNYVSDKFGIPLAEFSKNNVREKLQSVNVKDEHIQNFVQVLNDCEIALFAGRNTEGSAEAIYDRATKVIVNIEEDLK